VSLPFLKTRTLQRNQRSSGNRSSQIDDLRIASPCTADWDAMIGDNRVRHCALCNLNVYNFSEMTAREIRNLIAQREGRLCGRMFRRADGTILSRDCPRGLRAAAQRVSLWASAALSTLMAVGCASAPVAKEQIRIRPDSQASLSATSTDGLVQIQANKIETGLALTVTGLGDFIVAQASVTATPLAGGKDIVTGTTDERGKLSLPLKAGAYRVTIERTGFHPITRETDVTQGELTPLQFKLGQRVLMGDVASIDPRTGRPR
jgi:uncharacterized protein YeeX (DUF496 family)